MEEIRKDVLNLKDIAYMMDPSVLKLDSCLEDVEAMIAGNTASEPALHGPAITKECTSC